MFSRRIQSYISPAEMPVEMTITNVPVDIDDLPGGLPSREGPNAISESNPEMVVIEIEVEHSDHGEEDDENEPESPFVTLFRIINFLLLAPYRFATDMSKVTFLERIPFILQQILFVVYSLAVVRKNILYGIHITGETTIFSYINFAKVMIQVAFRVCFFYMVCTKFECFKKTVEYVNNTIYSRVINTNVNKAVVVGLVLLSGIMAGVRAYTGAPCAWDGFSKTAKCIGIDYFKNAKFSITSSNYQEYIDNMNAVDENDTFGAGSIISGIIFAGENFFGTFANQVGKDMFIVNALVLKVGAEAFEALIPDSVPSTDDSIFRDIKVWYKELKKISKLLNSQMHILYPLFLADNLVKIASFYNYSFNPEIRFWKKLVLAIEVGKILVFFYLAERVSNRITQFRNWLRDDSEEILERQEALVFLEELATNPIGVGSDTLFVNKGFIISFVGISIGYFLSIVETRKKNAS